MSHTNVVAPADICFEGEIQNVIDDMKDIIEANADLQGQSDSASLALAAQLEDIWLMVHINATVDALANAVCDSNINNI